MTELLAAAGYRVEPVEEPPCCGALAHHVGESFRAKALAERVLSADDGEAIWIATAAGCGAHLKELSHLLAFGERKEAAGAFSARVRDLAEALDLAPRPLRFLPPAGETVVYQDACHLRHAQGISESPRRWLLRAGYRLLEAEEADLCCGSAGTYNLGQPEMAFRLGRRKAAALLATGAQAVVSGNPGCLVQLRAHLRGTPLRLLSTARALALRLAREPAPTG
jgi:glycolate oxidase iron-sulfur subunit